MFGIIAIATYAISASPICTMVMPSCASVNCADTQNCMIVTPFNGCPKAQCIEIIDGKANCPGKAICKLDRQVDKPVICTMVMPTCQNVDCSETQNCMIVSPFNGCPNAECVEIIDGKADCPAKSGCKLDRATNPPVMCPMVMPTCQNVACSETQNCMIVTPFNGCPRAQCVEIIDGDYQCPAKAHCSSP
ncbi:hypothetical protein HDV04_004202 [Boothiomyces sp. JEL0838]|nr:hypothetical protein HDV04_004202 [Boothiomyces sp. JEL0838]